MVPIINETILGESGQKSTYRFKGNVATSLFEIPTEPTNSQRFPVEDGGQSIPQRPGGNDLSNKIGEN